MLVPIDMHNVESSDGNDIEERLTPNLVSVAFVVGVVVVVCFCFILFFCFCLFSFFFSSYVLFFTKTVLIRFYENVMPGHTAYFIFLNNI